RRRDVPRGAAGQLDAGGGPDRGGQARRGHAAQGQVAGVLRGLAHGPSFLWTLPAPGHVRSGDAVAILRSGQNPSAADGGLAIGYVGEDLTEPGQVGERPGVSGGREAGPGPAAVPRTNGPFRSHSATTQRSLPRTCAASWVVANFHFRQAR